MDLAVECLSKRSSFEAALALAKLKTRSSVDFGCHPEEVKPSRNAKVCSNPLHTQTHPTGGCLICLNFKRRRLTHDD